MPWPAGNLGAELGSPPCRCVCVDGAPPPCGRVAFPSAPTGSPPHRVSHVIHLRGLKPNLLPSLTAWTEGCLPMYRMASCRQACLGKVPYLCCLLQLQSSRSADAVASLAQYEVSVSSRMLPMQEQTQQKTEEKAAVRRHQWQPALEAPRGRHCRWLPQPQPVSEHLRQARARPCSSLLRAPAPQQQGPAAGRVHTSCEQN